MIVLLDQDGVLADFDTGLYSALRERHPSIDAIPPEHRRHFRAVEDYPEHCRDAVAATYAAEGFFIGLPPKAGAIRAVEEMLSEGIDVRICTAPIDEYEHCVREKYRWIERHLGRDMTRRIILSKDKTLVHGDWLIDDNPDVQGTRNPDWRQAVFDAPYNRHVTGPRISWTNWRSVLVSKALAC